MTKAQKERAKKIALSYYEADHGKDAAAALLADVAAAGSSVHFIEGGSLAVYYDDQRKELQQVYEQSDEKAASYSDEKVWNTYLYVMSQAIALLKAEA